MWIQVRTIDGRKTIRVDNLSKLTKIEDLRERLIEPFDAPVGMQRLFFRGKQMEDGHSLFDYDVGLNDLLQLMVRQPAPVPTGANSAQSQTTSGYASSEDGTSSDKENARPETPKPVLAVAGGSGTMDDGCPDSTYKIGDIIDAMDPGMGAWFEARIIKIERESCSENCHTTDTENKVQTDTTQDINANKCDKAAEDDSSVCSPAGEDADMKDDSGEQEEVKNDEIPKKSGLENCACDMDDDAQHKTDDSPASGSDSPRLRELKKVPEDGFIYSIAFDGYDDDEDPVKVSSDKIRPRARRIIPLSEVQVGLQVMANFNVEEPESRGFWYDCIISGKRVARTVKELKATVFIGADQMPLDDCVLRFVDEIFAIEESGEQMTAEDAAQDPTATPTKRQTKPECSRCQDNPRRKCKHCACSVCGGKNNPERQIICDECDMAYHLECLQPPLDGVPEEDDWYCPDCKNDDSQVVRAGEKLKESKKKSKMASANSKSTRDWGKGMACVGRTKMCTIVPPNHFGPIPSVEVGMQWKFRVQVSEAGVHRPHVAGIHGREDEGAYSIVLSGGYEDDVDNGEEFTYTGSGGRDLSGNKRTAEQSCDQTLTRMNKALAKNCNAALDSKKGAVASDWKAGKPVRVVRNCKGRKHSKYAPEEGNRYDGIYKVVKYWPDKGLSGFVVWRYMLRRDDPVPPPWSSAGRRRMEELGLTMQYPDGYLESQKEKEEQKGEEDEDEAPKKGKRGRKGKRKAEGSPESQPEKKSRAVVFKMESELMKLIKEDQANRKLWDEALTHTKEGKPKFLSAVEELFVCICCQDVAFKPVTLDCSHNVCKSCLSRSFKAEVHSCPACRFELPKDFSMPVNKTLSKLLNAFFPGYENGR